MAEHRVATKGRRMGSSRRKQLREGSGEAPAPAPSPGEEPPWASEIAQRVQDFFKERDKDQAGFVTRSDMQKLQEEDFPCSMEELELVFDGLDTAGTGRLSTEEFTAGLRQFLRSQKAARDHRRRKTASRRVRLVLPSPTLEGADSEERRHFAAFMDQLGTANVSEEQEIWQLWVKLRQDEPQLLGNLEDFLAKMRHRIQEARSKKKALEVTLNKHVAEHDKEVQQLCEALEQQIHQEQQQLQQESMARSHQHSVELQQALDASEREVQRLVMAQMELETRCRSLRSTQQAASTENQQLEESNRVLEDHLQHLRQQLQQTQGRLQAARASVVWERTEEPGDGAAAELPGEMPLSPQTSLEKSEKHRSEMRIRLGSQSGEPKAKATYQVVWEMPPADISLLGAPQRASSAEEDPFPEFLKEERFSDQSSLLREMNDAIAALSKQLKPQAPAASPAPADAAHHPQDDAEPQTGPEAATAHGTTPGVGRKTLPGHISHQPVEGDLQEGPAAAELRAPDVTQAGASVGAGHRRAQEPGAEQGESPEEAWRMSFLQGKGAGVKELMLKAAEHLQGAPGESMEAGEQALMEVEVEGWMQEKTGWEKAQPPGEAEEAALSQGENLEAGLGTPEAGDAGLAAGWRLAMDELGPAAAPGELAQSLNVGLGEEADPPLGLSEKPEVKPGECLEPEPPSPGEAPMGAAQGDGVTPEVTVAPGPGRLAEERVGAEVQPWGQTLDAEELPAQAQHGGSSRAGAEEGDVEGPQPQGESARGAAAVRGGSLGAGVTVAAPPAEVQDGGAGPDVAPLEAQSSNANMQLLPEVEAALQPPGEAGFPGTEQGGSLAPDVEPLDQVDKPEFVEMEAEDSQADMKLCGGPSLETPQGCHAALQHVEEAEDGAQGLEEHELPCEPALDPQGAGVGQAEGAGAGVEPPEEAEILHTLEDQSIDANVQLIAEADELQLTPGGGTETDLQPQNKAGALWTEQGGSPAPDVEPRDQVDKPEFVEMEAGDSQADMEPCEGPSLEILQGCHAALQHMEEAEDGAQGQGERELPHEPVFQPHRVTIRQAEGAGAGLQPQEEPEILDTLEDQSTDANVQLIEGAGELKLTPGGSTETDLQPLSEAGALWTKQGWSLAPGVEPLDQVDKPELVGMVEAEDSQADTQLRGGPSPETPQGWEDHAALQHVEEAEDGAQGLEEHELPHEPVLDPQGAGVGQGEGTGAGVEPPEEAEILDTLEDQSIDANVQLIAEADELKLTPGGGTETDLQPQNKAGALWTEQGGSLAPGVEPLDQVDKEESVEMEAGDSQADMELCGSPSLETLQGCHAALQHVEEAEDGAQGLEEHELPCEPALDPQGAGVGQGEGTGAGVEPPEEVGILDTLEDQSIDANVQLIAEADELKLTQEGSTETDLQLSSEASSLDTEQGGSLAPDVEPLDQADKPESVELEIEDTQADTKLHGGLSPEAPRGGPRGAAMQLGEEAEDGAQGLEEHEVPHEPVLDPQGAGVGQGEGAGAGVEPPEEAEILDTLEDQSIDANVQLIAEADELQLTPGGGTETDLQPQNKAGALWTEQGGSPAPDVEPRDQVDKPEFVEMEAGDSQADMEPCEGPSLEILQGCHAALQHMEEAEDGAQGQDERELPHEPVFQPHRVTIRQGEGAGAGLQPQEEPEILDTLEDQSTDANVQLIEGAGELKLTPGGSTETDLQPLSEAGALWTKQGWSLAPGVEPLDQVDKPELVGMVEAEDSQADTQLRGGPSPETPQGWEDHAALQHVEEAEDGAQGLEEHELPHEPVLDPQGAGVGQGEGTGAGVEPPEEAEILDTLEAQSTDANVQLIAEADELKLTPGGGTETDLQPQNKAGALWTEQGGSLAPDVEPLDQVDKEESVEMEAGDSQADMKLCGTPSLETPQGCHAALQHMEEAEDGAQGLEEHELPCEPALDPQGAGVGQGEGTGAGVEPPEEVGILDTLEDQSIDANVQLIAEADELKLTQEGSTETDLQLSSEASSLDTEQGGSLAPDVEPLDQADKPESVELEIEDTQADTKLHGGLSPEAPRGGPRGAAMQLGEEAEDGAQGLEEHELPREPVLDPQGAGVGQGEGAGAGVEPPEEAEILHTLEAQSTDANAQPVAEADKLKLTLGWSSEADLAPWDAAGMREEEQSQMPGSMAGLCAAHTADAWEGAAGAHASPPAEATLYPERAAAAEGPALGAKLGALAGPGGQILEDTQPLELPQGDGAAAEGGPLDGAQGLEVVQGERLEAGASLGETQDLGLKQGHDDGASALASPVSKVPVQISTLKLETMMQEDVLVPDVRRLSASGQGAQSELQEQVSAQADKVRLHTASQQPEEKPPHVMETEQAAAGPAEPPKPEVPPASTLHMRVRQEDAGNDQLGMVLGDSSLGDAANSSLQPQRQLVGEQGDDLTVGQREKQQEVGQKMSQKSQPSPGELGAVTADGAGAAPRGSPEASPDPDHLYNVLFIGDSHVGKTSFLYRLHADTFNPHLAATVGLDYHVKNLIVDNKCFALRLWDSAGQERYRSITKQFFRKADGVVVMYDITSEYSFSDTRYWLSCIQEGAEDGVVILLLGNKTDCAAERQVPTKEGERLAKEHQLMFYECSAASGHNVSESMVSLIRSLKVREDELKNEAKEVAKPPQKKKGCCW